MTVTTVVLDVNETLFSLDPVARRFAEVGLDGALELFFARVLRDGFAVAAMGRFAAFPAIARHHVTAMAGDDGAAAEHVLAGFDEVTLHDDVAEGLAAMREAGLRTVAFTNGTAGIAAGALERGGVDHLVDDVHDVGELGAWKPSPAAYGWVCEVCCDVAPHATAMVAVHPWDVAGAMRSGFVGAWVERSGDAAWPGFLAPPTTRVRRLADVVDALT